MAEQPARTVAVARLPAWIALLAYMALLSVLSHQPSLPAVGHWFPR